MAAYDNLCMSCMADRGEDMVCPLCGFSETESQPPHALPYRTLLQDRYLVGRVKQENGEGFRYIGYDTMLHLPVKIRELFPQNLCQRAGNTWEIQVSVGQEAVFREVSNSFLEYSRIIGRLREVPAMEKIYDIFETNHTAYTIAEWSEQISLRYFVERSGGVLHWNDARQLFLPVFSALKEMHAQGIGHYGLSPDSISILKDGSMRLIDFAIRPVRQLRTSLQPDLAAGCAALEQYVMNAPLTESTDVYGVAANLFFALTGDLPLDAVQRQKDGKLLIATNILRQIPPHVVTALANALQVPPEQRTSTIAELEEQLASTPAVTSTISIEDTKMLKKIPVPYEEKGEEESQTWEPPPPKKKSLLWLWITLPCVGVAALSAILLSVFLPSRNQDLLSHSQANASSGALADSQETMASYSLHNSGENSVASSVETMAAPNLVGQVYADAVGATKEVDHYDVMLGEKVFDASVPEGNIISQTPEPGETMVVNGSVVVKVSQGSARRTLPEVAGLSLADACEKITAEGFTVVKIDDYSDTVPAEQVIGYQTVKAGETLNYGTEVTLILSKGPQE
ncbi:MAG: PASTA domain-containing protein [Clostridiales bacterium]|jgi:serine/threonine protein kinase|nr:PASTA domain-containing protein [Clostridiales bacterium]